MTAYPDGGPLGLAGWQAAFVAVGLPGLLLAIWVLSLKEPVRGAIDGLPTPETELLALFRAAARETTANRTGFYRLTLSANALRAYIARRKQCDAMLQEAFSGRVKIASGKGEKSVVRKE